MIYLNITLKSDFFLCILNFKHLKLLEIMDLEVYDLLLVIEKECCRKKLFAENDSFKVFVSKRTFE